MTAKVGTVNQALIDFARERGDDTMAETLEAINAHGGLLEAAAALGVNKSTVSRRLKAITETAAIAGLAPGHPGWTHPVPHTHVAKGVSVYHPVVKETLPDGSQRVVEPGVWVKADLRREAYIQAIKDSIADAVHDFKPRDVDPGPQKDYSTDVIPWLQIGDAHIGMLAHAAETGESFDLKIGERELCAAVAQLIDEMPACERAVINDLGDFTHYENMQGETEASGHKLDYDGRFPKMIKSYRRIMMFIVEKVLEKARVVDVIINQGNHSRTNDLWMRELLDVAYGHTGRVNVLDNSSVFIAYRMGKTFVMTHHSDKCKPTQLAHVMATDFAKDWGETEFRYIDIGHIHHSMVSKEHPGVQVESWNILAAKDKYAHDGGWRSRQSITVVLRSKTYGDIGRRLLPIQEVRARLEALGHETPKPKAAFTV
jgi:hypothetical protein